MLAFVKKIVFALILAALVLFAYQNLTPLSQSIQFEINPYYREPVQTPNFPVVFLFVVFFLLGMLAAGFHGVYERMARRMEIRRRDKRIRELEKENSGLRAQVAELRPPPSAEARAGGESFPEGPLPGALDSSPREIAPPPASKPAEEEPTL
jgi:hypothetical protein